MPTIKLRNSQTASANTFSPALQQGEVGINEADGILYYRDTSGNPTALVWSGGTFTDSFEIAAGSAASPAIAFSDDTNGNGIYRPAANELGFSTNGSPAFRVNSSGQLLSEIEAVETSGSSGLVLNNINYAFTGTKGKSTGLGCTRLAGGDVAGVYLVFNGLTCFKGYQEQTSSVRPFPASSTILESQSRIIINPSATGPLPPEAFTAGLYFSVSLPLGQDAWALYSAGTGYSYFRGSVLFGRKTSGTQYAASGYQVEVNGAFLVSGTKSVFENNAGFGEPNPTAPLHVSGEAKFDGPITEGVFTQSASTSAITLSLDDGTVHDIYLSANCTITMPSAVAGQSFTVLLRTGVGGYAAVFSGVKWPDDSAPTTTQAGGKLDIFTFVSDGSNWYGAAQQNYTA